MSEQPGAGYRLFFDIGSPYAWLVCEAASSSIPHAEWIPVCQQHVDDGPLWDGNRQRVVELAHKLSLLEPRFDEERSDLLVASSLDMALAATYTKSLGRTIAFSLSALRQVHAAAKPIDEHITILIAGAGCEMATGAIEAGIKMQSTIDQLAAAEQELRELTGGRTELPVLIAADGTATTEDALLALAIDDFRELR